jgi:hypothetical protein
MGSDLAALDVEGTVLADHHAGNVPDDTVADEIGPLVQPSVGTAEDLAGGVHAQGFDRALDAHAQAVFPFAVELVPDTAFVGPQFAAHGDQWAAPGFPRYLRSAHDSGRLGTGRRLWRVVAAVRGFLPMLVEADDLRLGEFLLRAAHHLAQPALFLLPVPAQSFFACRQLGGGQQLGHDLVFWPTRRDHAGAHAELHLMDLAGRYVLQRHGRAHAQPIGRSQERVDQLADQLALPRRPVFEVGERIPAVG